MRRASEWLLAAVLAVANASAGAAGSGDRKSQGGQLAVLRDQVYEVLARTFEVSLIARKKFPFIGRSGKQSTVLSLPSRRSPYERLLLIDTVVPHHVSVAAKYVAFADTRLDKATGSSRFAVYDRPLDAGDASLLQQVAILLPIRSLGARSEESFGAARTAVSRFAASDERRRHRARLTTGRAGRLPPRSRARSCSRSRRS